MADNLQDLEMEIEERGMSDGEKRYIAKLAKAYGHSGAVHAAPVRHLLGVSLEWLAAELRVRKDTVDNTRGATPLWCRWVDKLGEETCAYLTLKSALNGVGSVAGMSLTIVARNLTRMLVDEIRSIEFKEQDPEGFANALNHMRGRSVGDRLVKRARYHKVELSKTPSPGEAVKVGIEFLGIMVEGTGLFKIEVRQRSGQRRPVKRYFLVPEPHTIEWIEQRSQKLRLLTPIHPPMVIPPADWGPGGQKGGYRYSLRDSLPLVRRASPIHERELAAEPMPLVYSALNSLQSTAWRVNEQVLEVVRLAVEGRLPALLPSPEDEPIPARPPKTDEEAFKKWRQQAAEIHQSNQRRRFQRNDAVRALAVAEDSYEKGTFYFPYSLDFRGRAYPAVDYFHPHGSDIVRGMLCFSDKVELTEVGRGWLAVHGANQLGVWRGRKISKMNFEERVTVVREAESEILYAAQYPLQSKLWQEADEPWQFLAFCFEWARGKEPGPFMSHLPVSLDGTCNGLQHFSAILRDPVGAEAVNMVPNDWPTDIYGQVAERVSEILGERLHTEQEAKLWVASGLVTRSLCKRPVMTLAYGATKYGFVDQLLETLRGDLELWEVASSTFRPSGISIRKMCQYLGGLLWEVLKETVSGALRAMEWLQNAAISVVSSTKESVSWSVPLTGFPARMEYWRPKRLRVRTMVAGQVIQPSVYANTNKPLTPKIRNSIAPNVIHSLDAAAMFATTVACASRGVPAFSMIHDSYAVHAEYIPTLADALRTAFIALYRDRNILADVADQWRARGVEVPDPPPMGEFDVSVVRHAPFFFS